MSTAREKAAGIISGGKLQALEKAGLVVTERHRCQCEGCAEPALWCSRHLDQHAAVAVRNERQRLTERLLEIRNHAGDTGLVRDQAQRLLVELGDDEGPRRSKLPGAETTNT